MAVDKVSREFGELLFNEAAMQQRLPRPTYKELLRVMRNGEKLNLEIANEVAHAMKEWALEHGATHYAHWFQPLTGITSEKHDSFLTPKDDGSILMSFSGKELIQGEPDASSFPSGGLRATFEARGYTAWDPTSPAFIKDEVLCIPTAFVSYRGEALDKKTALLRSQAVLSKQTKRVLALFGKEPTCVYTTVGPEQEYFLIKEADYQARPDLVLTGRTLFGCKPAKGQELEEHYFGAIRPTVNAFMKEVDDELWKLGVPIKTKHNEVAPSQHELAPIFEHGSRAIDDNLLTMEKLKLLATKHGLACLEHEKPFSYVNGSGKHDNWSLCADGKNLLEPGDAPGENLQFLLFLTFLIGAVDRHADLLRASVASAGNDHRLGAHEAPPAIISIFLGDELSQMVRDLIADKPTLAHGETRMDLGVTSLPAVRRDNTDRNRTSPFAFTGNKFEFRMCGSQQNISDPNVVLNTAVAEQCDEFADAMERELKDLSHEDFEKVVLSWVKARLKEHERILFEGNGYSEEWEQEAKKRGLPNSKNTPDALQCMLRQENIDFYERYGVLSAKELHARFSAKAEQYAKLIHIEANTMIYMVRHMYLPALLTYSSEVAAGAATKAELGIVGRAEKMIVQKLTDGIDTIYETVERLEGLNDVATTVTDDLERCMNFRDNVIPCMTELRAAVDEMEKLCGGDWWPVPSYNQLLFWV